MSENYNYYKEQLNILQGESFVVKVIDNNGYETKWLTINNESIPELIEFLQSKISKNE